MKDTHSKYKDGGTWECWYPTDTFYGNEEIQVLGISKITQSTTDYFERYNHYPDKIVTVGHVKILLQWNHEQWI